MARRLFKLSIGPDAREYDLHGTRSFPCEIYETVMQSMLSGHIPEHWHQEAEIGYVDRGRILLSCNEETCTLQEGDIYFISSANRHSMREKSVKSAFYSIVFHEDMVAGPDSINEKYLFPVLHDKRNMALVFRDRKVLDQLKEVIRLGEDQPLGYELLIRNHLSNLVLWLYKNYRSEQEIIAEPEWPERIEMMLTFIANNYMADIQVKEIAESAHISTRECYRSFRKELGQSPTVYLHEYRLKKAADLLISTDRKIEEIARDCGYVHSGYFSTKFKELYQCTPLEYRRVNQTADR